jgi:hypothetical protein
MAKGKRNEKGLGNEKIFLFFFQVLTNKKAFQKR